MSAKSKVSRPCIQPRIRILLRKDIAIGPGKAELLELVHNSGSIGEAARRMGMSYMRAWLLIRTMNQCFKEPLVATLRGGRRRGGATLTTTGRKALALYQRIEEQSLQASESSWKELRRLLRN